MATENKIQTFVHKLEQGGWVRRVKQAVLLAAITFMIGMYFFDVTIPIVSQGPNGFRGLSHEKAIAQAQISRELSRGHGFSTQMITPAALWQFQKNKGSFPLDRTPDTYHAPLNPFINSLIFRVMDGFNGWLREFSKEHEYFSRYVYEETMSSRLIIYAYDKILAFTQVVFLLLAVMVSYFTARRLFDARLGVLGMGLLLLCQQFWDFAMSGLPQMLMLFLFSCAVHTLVRAVEARYLNKNPLPWLAAMSVLFGLLALTHGLTIWIFVGALFFTLIFFRPFGRDAAIVLAIFMVIYGPWMVRNYKVCGSPVGMGWYSGLVGIHGTESSVMRSLDIRLDEVTPRVFRRKIQDETLYQLDNIYVLMGSIPVALVFFVALLHLFKKPETASLRWGLGLMWLFGFLGMAVFGISERGVLKANDLHVLFIPMMTFYGLAFLMVMWTRLEINVKLLRRGFLTLIYVICALPFINNFLDMIGPPRQRIQWPPYVPPSIAYLAQLTEKSEVITSDMPWAVAWYADRKSLWLPNTIKDFMNLNDYNQLKGQIVGLYLTPVTGNASFISDIVKGEYKEWAPFIMRNVNSRDFPLKAVTALPIENECIFYADRDRWTRRED